MGVEVCPVHKAELKSSYISSIHVGVMSQNSQPGGQKRKRPDDEEEDDDPPPAPNRRHPHFDVRPQILDISYTKLELFRKIPIDSNLSRYVKVINTLRNLEQDMLKDGMKVGPSGSLISSVNHPVPFDPTRPPPPDDARTNLNSLEYAVNSVSYSPNPYAMDTESRTATTSVINSSDAPNDIFGGVTSCTTYSSEYDRYLMDLDGPSSGRATPFIRSDAESGALWNEDSDRLTSLNWSSVLKMEDGNPMTVSTPYPETAVESMTTSCNFDASSNSSSGCSSDCSISDDAMSCSETSLHTLMPVTTGIPMCMNTAGASSSSSSSSPKVTSTSGSSSSQSGSSPPNSEDEIFGDIDLALYDYDFTPLSPPNLKMAPVSAEELMRNVSLSSDQNHDSSVHTNNYYKKDFCTDDREHLTSVRT